MLTQETYVILLVFSGLAYCKKKDGNIHDDIFDVNIKMFKRAAKGKNIFYKSVDKLIQEDIWGKVYHEKPNNE